MSFTSFYFLIFAAVLEIPWLEFDDAKYHSYDGSHLSGGAAKELTRQIANELKERRKLHSK